jgi:hypothetical protein
MLALVALFNIINNEQQRRVVIKIIVEVGLNMSIGNSHDFSVNIDRIQGVATSSSIWDVSVRVYIGCEYECSRGHRFICSSPNHVIRVAQNGIVKVRRTYSFVCIVTK